MKKNAWLVDEPVRCRGKEEAVRFKRLLNYAVVEKIIGAVRAAGFARMSVTEFEKEIGAVI